MKILMVCYEDMSGYNGGVIQVLEIAKALRRRGHIVRILAPAIGRPERDIRPVGIGYIPILNVSILRPLSYLLSAPFHLAAEIMRERPQAAVVFQTWFSFWGVVISRTFGLRTLFFINGITEEEIRVGAFLLHFGVMEARVRGSWLFIHLANLIHGINVRLAHMTAAVDEATVEYNVKRFVLPRDRIRVVRNGADIALFSPMDRSEARRLAGIGHAGPIVGFVGGLFPWHGVDILVEAAARIVRELPDVRFLIVGDGPMRPSLSLMVKERGLEGHFVFTGSVPHGAVPLYINSFDVGIMFFKPVRSYGGSPLKLYEYMACGLPVAASPLEDYGGMLERHGAGISVDTSKPEAVAEAMVPLLTNEELRKEMGRRGREAAVREFSWDRCARDLEEVLEV